MEEGPPNAQASDSDRGPVWDLILNVLQVIGAGAALVGWITVVGGANLWARFDAAGLPSPIRSVTVVPRESLFAEGLRGMAGPLALAAAGSVVVYLLLRRRVRSLEDAAATLEEEYADRYQAKRLGLDGDWPKDEGFDRYVRWREERDRRRLGRALAAIAPHVPDAAAGPPPTWRTSIVAWWRRKGNFPRPGGRFAIAVIVVIVVVPLLLDALSTPLNWGASLLIVSLTLALTVPLISALWRRARPYGLRGIVATVAAGFVVGGLAGVVAIVATVDVALAFLYALAGLVLLAVFIALARLSTPLRTAGTVFALLTLYLGVFGFLRELSDPTPALDPGQVVAKDPPEQIAGRYVSRLGGDVYIATRAQRDGDFQITMVPKERVVALFVGPSHDIPKDNTPAARDEANEKGKSPPQKKADRRAAEAALVAAEPTYTPTPTPTSTVTATPTQDKNTPSPQPGGDEPEPLPDEPPVAADAPPKVEIGAFATEELGEDGSFLFEFPAFGEDVTGVASFDTKDRLPVPATADEPARTVRIQLATQSFESTATAKRVLVRVRLSGVARRVVTAKGSLEVTVTVVAVGRTGRAGRDDGCFYLAARRAKKPAGKPKC